MSLTQQELGLISSNYRNYKSKYEATKSMPKVLAYVRELEARVAELEAAAKKAPAAPAAPAAAAAPAAPAAPAKKAPAKKAPAKKKSAKKK